MRNKHKPADQQDPLLRSSDSEEDHKALMSAEDCRKKCELENNTVDDLWDEVSGPPSSKNNSSCSSADDNESVGSQADHIAEQISNRRPLEGRPKNLYDTQSSDTEIIKKQEETEHNDKEQDDLQEVTTKGKRIMITEGKLDDLDAEKKVDEEVKDDDVKDDDVKDDVKESPEEGNETDPLESTEDNEKTPNSDSEHDPEDLMETCKALNTLSQNQDKNRQETAQDIRNKLVEEMLACFQPEVPDTSGVTLEELLDNESIDEPSELEIEPKYGNNVNGSTNERLEDLTLFSTAKTREQMDFEEDCAMANEKCSHDLEEMGMQMEEDLQELRKSSEPLCGLMDDSIDQSDTETDEEALKVHLEAKSPLLTDKMNECRKQLMTRMESNPDSAKLPTQESSNFLNESEREQLFAKILDNSTDNVPTRVFGAGHDIPAKDWSKEELKLQLARKELKSPDKEDNVFKNPITNMTSMDAAERICAEMHLKMAAEEEELRKLLQQLENETNEMYNIETTVEYQQEVVTEDSELRSICTSLLDELIEELIAEEPKPKNFEFGVIESDEEFSYSAEPKLEKLVPPELEDPARGKSIRECLDTFSDFVNSMADPTTETLLGRKHTSGVEKIRAAQELLKSKNLEEFNKDTPESLDARINMENEKRKRHVANSAARCFAQRDKYDDTLEVVENKLMVVKKDTGELEELPPPPPLVSDSESDYDYDTAEEEKSLEAYMKRPWTTPYQPKPRKSEEHLVLEALQRAGLDPQSDQYADEEKENEPESEFHSLEAMTTFGNLDTEFFQKLDLQKIPNNEEAEAAIECMRSYNELKACMKSGSREVQFTNEETEMLQTILTKDDGEASKSKPVDPKVEEEDELLKKMVIRMKEYEERERQLQLIPPAPSAKDTSTELGAINLSVGRVKIFEQKSQVDVTEEDDPEDKDKTFNELKEETVVNSKSKVSEEGSGDHLIEESKPKHRHNNDIDDDGLSDAPTDYESGEEVAMVEPPKLPESVLKSFYSEEFKADLKMVQEREEATRRNLCSLHEKNSQISLNSPTSREIGENASRSEIEQKICPAELARLKASEAAKAKWAIISKRLHNFLDPEDISRLDKQAFGDSDECDDEEDFKFEIIDEQNEEQEPEDGVMGDEKEIDIVETIIEDKQPEEGNGPNTECEKKDNLGDTSQAKADTPLASGSETTNIASNDKKPFIIDYFEAPEENTTEDDAIYQESVQTQEIECSLEILDDDGEVVIKEIGVSAQVTFK